MLFAQWHMKRLLSLQTSDYASPLPDNYLVSKNLSKEFCYLKTEQFILLVVRLFRNLFSSLSFIARQPFWHSFCIMEMMQAVPSQSQRLLQRYEGLPLSTSNHLQDCFHSPQKVEPTHGHLFLLQPHCELSVTCIQNTSIHSIIAKLYLWVG